ncbi:class I SAM-dependent methyltransferase [Agrobacterium tumefaciens]|uniref:class I SAM-dependent methyltransferase n=1 Tax=Agrobacterium tumefaciens TaxID=358 RepID=UPI001574E2A7|nr:class I SAM-dependent methyltransferase [Agrobacterium tumefaciens]
MDGGNFDLKEEIRDYWSKRSETFDLAFGHKIAAGAEANAWQKPIRDLMGPEPKHILELACGTGEVTRLIHDLGHEVTALDFPEAMLSVARAKHAGKPRLRFVMADAENTMEPDASYDAIICRHLVWTLTQPEETFREWFRLLRPGGRLLFFDGDWATPKPAGRLASLLIRLIDLSVGADKNYDGAQSSHHAAIMKALPFGQGLRPQMLKPLLIAAGFTGIELHSHAPIARAQRKNTNLRNRLRTFVYRRFILTCRRP